MKPATSFSFHDPKVMLPLNCESYNGQNGGIVDTLSYDYLHVKNYTMCLE